MNDIRFSPLVLYQTRISNTNFPQHKTLKGITNILNDGPNVSNREDRKDKTRQEEPELTGPMGPCGDIIMHVYNDAYVNLSTYTDTSGCS